MNKANSKLASGNNVEEPEGLDSSESFGWGDYPLDSVFVRKEQRTVNEVVTRIKNNRYILNPDFQRDFVWPIKKQARLIESCLMRIPLPVFYVAEAKDGRIIVVDGLQRLTTFVRFLNDDFSLSGLGGGKEGTTNNILLGKRFSGLSVTLQERLLDTQLTLYILDANAPDRAKLDIFERVNSGEPLARQQMRNCLFSGPATQWLKKASDSNIFLKATGGSLDKKTMRDREAINRFCGFYLLEVSQYRGDMDDFLARTLEKMNKFSDSKLIKTFYDFELSMKRNFELFERHAFRKSLAYNELKSGRSVINISLFDVCSVFLARLEENMFKKNAKFLRNSLISLLNNATFIHSISYATNDRKQVVTRFEMVDDIFGEVN